MSIKELKAKGRTAFRANHWRCVVAATETHVGETIMELFEVTGFSDILTIA